MARSFRYLRPNSAQEAAVLKAELGSGAVFWAGGTDLLLQWRRGSIEVGACIDLSGLDELHSIDINGESVTIGAMTTIATLETHPGLRASLPVLSALAERFATPQVRTMATLGGNLCHAVPSADYSPPLIALDAGVTLRSPTGARTLPLESLFVGPKATALAGDEILTHVTVPMPADRSGCTYERMVRSSVDIALAGVACRLDTDDAGLITSARVVLGAVAPTPVRSQPAEALLEGTGIGEVTGDLLDQVGAAAAADTNSISDVRAGAAYRTHTAGVLTRRAVSGTARSLAA